MEPKQDAKRNCGRPENRKKPYEKPRVIAREGLESVAAACVPAPPGKPDPVSCASPQS